MHLHCRSSGSVRIAFAIVIVVPLLCIGGAAIAVMSANNAPERAIADAEARWRMRGFSHYVMILEELNCMVEIEVASGRVARVTPLERCTRDGRTVEDLFALARRDGDTGMRCIALGCACDDRLSVESVFHPFHGYPTSIYVRIEAQPNWRHPDAWRYFLAHGRSPSCNLMAGDKLIRVVSFRSLP